MRTTFTLYHNLVLLTAPRVYWLSFLSIAHKIHKSKYYSLSFNLSVCLCHSLTNHLWIMFSQMFHSSETYSKLSHDYMMFKGERLHLSKTLSLWHLHLLLFWAIAWLILKEIFLSCLKWAEVSATNIINIRSIVAFSS